MWVWRSLSGEVMVDGDNKIVQTDVAPNFKIPIKPPVLYVVDDPWTTHQAMEVENHFHDTFKQELRTNWVQPDSLPDGDPWTELQRTADNKWELTRVLSGGFWVGIKDGLPEGPEGVYEKVVEETTVEDPPESLTVARI